MIWQYNNKWQYLNTVALVHKRTILTERPLFVSKYQPLRIEGAVWSARRFPTSVNLDFLNPEPLVLPSSSNYPQEAEWLYIHTCCYIAFKCNCIIVAFKIKILKRRIYISYVPQFLRIISRQKCINYTSKVYSILNCIHSSYITVILFVTS
jgi:hypothetical protein